MSCDKFPYVISYHTVRKNSIGDCENFMEKIHRISCNIPKYMYNNE